MYQRKTEETDIYKKIADFEKNKDNEDSVNFYWNWERMNEYEQKSAYRQWSSYYDACSRSKLASLYQQAKEAIKARDFEALRLITSESKAIRSSERMIMQPSCIDPFSLLNRQGFQSYKLLQDERAVQEGRAKEATSTNQVKQIFT